MPTALITGAAGLVGSEAVRLFDAKGFHVLGIDNDMRRRFFGDSASTIWNRQLLEETIPDYEHFDVDVRDRESIEALFARWGPEIAVVIHAAAQPSHEWATREPHTDFSINAMGTLVLLEATRRYCPDAVFIFTSTNKVYGDGPNRLPLSEKETRWEIDPDHPYGEYGIDEQMTLDRATHSLFGASKVAADVMVQEYGRYFGLKTACFRCGCLTGPNHSGAMLHGFLSYLVKCAISGEPYTIFGYRGKQVRDNMHSYDLVSMFWHYYLDPRPGEVYNAGGGRPSNCSVREAIAMCEAITGRPMNKIYSEANRKGDHVWYISDTRRFQSHYPGWSYTYDLQKIVEELFQSSSARAGSR